MYIRKRAQEGAGAEDVQILVIRSNYWLLVPAAATDRMVHGSVCRTIIHHLGLTLNLNIISAARYS